MKNAWTGEELTEAEVKTMRWNWWREAFMKVLPDIPDGPREAATGAGIAFVLHDAERVADAVVERLERKRKEMLGE